MNEQALSNIILRIDPDVKMKFQIVSLQRGVSMSSIIRLMIDATIKDDSVIDRLMEEVGVE